MRKIPDETIVQMYLDGVPVEEITKAAGITSRTLYLILRKNNVQVGTRNKSVLEKDADAVREMWGSGATKKEVAERFGVSVDSVKTFIRNHKLQRMCEAKQHTVGEQQNNLEYIGGYKNHESTIRIRCKRCGAEFERSWDRFSRGKASCHVCRKREAEERKARDEERRRQEAEVRAEEREAIKAERMRVKADLINQREKEREHECPVCGTLTTRPKYCSARCAKKVGNKAREIRRRKKVSAVMIDNDITVPSLFKRDGGTCYLCGKDCHLDDYVVRDGIVITGDYYPSIDHVIPLAKGGAHSWDNVRLAHRICNSLKSDSMPPAT